MPATTKIHLLHFSKFIYGLGLRYTEKNVKTLDKNLKMVNTQLKRPTNKAQQNIILREFI